MLTRRRAAIGAICAALAVPSTALAGSAGDNQYQDPLGNSPPAQNKNTTTQNATPPPAPTPAASPTTTAASSAPTTTQDSRELPRTGLPLGPMIALGLGLIAAGVAIRRLA